MRTIHHWLTCALLSCSPDPGSRSAGAIAETATTPAGAATPPISASEATAPSAPPAQSSPAIEVPRDASGLWGKTIDFPYLAGDRKDKSRAYTGRIFVHAKALGAGRPLPLVVFFHGLNKALIPHRWMGGGTEGDVRRIVSELIESEKIPPVLLAGPGSVERAAVSHGASFPSFDFDQFVQLVEENLGDVARVDRARVVVTGHSGAGCSEKGGIVSATSSQLKPFALVSIDTCMPGSLAESLGRAPSDVHVLVTWQTATWDRNFSHFRATFERERKAHPEASGTLRELDQLPNLPRSHDATVKQTFDKWLPRLLGGP